MIKSLRALCCATVALTTSASAGLSQTTRQISVAFDNARLSDIAGNLATFAGRPITLAPSVGNPTLSGSAHHVPWDAALDRVLAAHALIARPDSAGGLRIERERRISVTFDNAPLISVTRELAHFSGYRIDVLGSTTQRRITATLFDTDWQRALDIVLAQVDMVARPSSSGVFQVMPRLQR